MAALTILHISDIHIGGHKGEIQPTIIKRIGEKVAEDISNAQTPPIDLVAVTGDMAFSGNSQQFEIFWNEAKNLLKRLDLPPNRLQFCPGNHDFDRTIIKESGKSYEYVLKQANSNTSSGDEYILSGLTGKDKEANRLLLEGWRNYTQSLIANMGMKGPAEECILRANKLQLNRVGVPPIFIVSMNSALVHVTNSSERGQGEGFCSKWQIDNARKVVEEIRATTSDAFVLGLYHHPLRVLIDVKGDPDTEKKLASCFDLALHGHYHRERFSTTGDLLEVGAGAMYDSDSEKFVYAVHTLDFDTGRLTTFTRTFDRARSDWIEPPEKTEYILRWVVDHQRQILERLRKSTTIIERLVPSVHQTSGLTMGPHLDLKSKWVPIARKYRIRQGAFLEPRVVDDIEEYLWDFLQDKRPIILVGQSGVGKTTVTRALLVRLRSLENTNMTLKSGNMTSEPVYLNLAFGREAEDTVELLSQYRPSITGVNLDLFIEGYDDYVPKVAIEGKEDALLTLLRRAPKGINIATISMHPNTFQAKQSLIFNSISPTAVTVRLDELSLDDPRMIAFVAQYLDQQVGVNPEEAGRIAKRAFETFRTWRSQRTGLPSYPLYILMLARIIYDQTSHSSINIQLGELTEFTLFFKFAESVFRSHGSQNFNEYFRDISEVAWLTYVQSEYSMALAMRSPSEKLSSSDESAFQDVLNGLRSGKDLSRFSNPEYSTFLVFHQTVNGFEGHFVHDSFIKFFSACHIVHVLLSAVPGPTLRQVLCFPSNTDITVFALDYLSEITRGNAAIAQQGGFSADKVVSHLQELYESLRTSDKALDWIARNEVLYYLGRMRHPVVSKTLEELWKDSAIGRNLPGERYLNEIAVRRTLLISLVKQGHEQMEAEYVLRLRDSKTERIVNLNFFQRFYLDLPLSKWFLLPFKLEDVPMPNTLGVLRASLLQFMRRPFHSRKLALLNTWTLLDCIALREGTTRDRLEEVLKPLSFAVLATASLGQVRSPYSKSEALRILGEKLDEILGHIKGDERIVLSFEFVKYALQLQAAGGRVGNFIELAMKHIHAKWGVEESKAYLRLVGLANLYSLKDVRRTGWVDRRVEDPESVMDHTASTILAAFVLFADKVPANNLSKMITMLLVHDLGESIIGDITPQMKARRRQKNRIEREAVELISEITNVPDFASLFAEFQTGRSDEAKRASRVDLLDPIIQALLYLDRVSNQNQLVDFAVGINSESDSITSASAQVNSLLSYYVRRYRRINSLENTDSNQAETAFE